MKPEPRVRATTRPLRTAYIVADGPDAHSWLTAIFTRCLALDGGRQSLIVPVESGGAISDSYWRWLFSFDPDLIVLATHEDSQYVREIVDRRFTADLQSCRRASGNDRPHVPADRTALTALSWLPFLKASAGWHRPAPKRVLDAYPLWTDDGLVSDNFGKFDVFGFPMHAQYGVGALMLTPPDPPADRWRFHLQDAEEITQSADVLNCLARDSSLICNGYLANLSSIEEVREHPWTRAFCLVIGDAFRDRVSGWNAGLLMGDAQNQAYKTLRVPLNALNSPEYASALGNFLRARNWIGAQNGPAYVVVRSHSVSHPELDAFAKKLSAASHAFVSAEPVASIDTCCPENAATPRVGFLVQTPARFAEAKLVDGKSTLDAPMPRHLDYCTGQHPLLSRGIWKVDLAVDRSEDIGRFWNVRERWVLPGRVQLASKFTRSPDARITNQGEIAISADVERGRVEVSQPSDAEFFATLLTAPSSAYVGPYDLRRPYLAPSAFEYCDVSDKGRYLTGTLGLFGGLGSADAFLGNHFWRVQLLAMSAPGQSERVRVTETLKRKLRASQGAATISEESQWEQLAEHVIKQSMRLRIPREVSSFSKLLPMWRAELEEVLAMDSHLAEHAEEMRERAPGELRRSIESLLQRNVFFRGHEWVCKECSHRNWVALGELKDIVPCSVCSNKHLLPVDVELDLRLNSFLSTCLREHDTLSVLGALVTLQQQSRSSFFFSPQLALWRKYPERRGSAPDRELDLVCMSDGKFLIGEAKAHTRLIKATDIQDLASSAREISADVALLSAFEGDEAVLNRRVQELQTLLGNSIEARGLISHWTNEPAHYLP